jgi:hypothetical protein
MAAEKSPDPNLSDDVQIIRDILFGEQARFFKEHIETLEGAVSTLQEETRQLRAALQSETEAREQAGRAGLEKLAGVEQQILRRVKSLEEQLLARIETENQERGAAQDEFLARLKQAQKEIAGEFAAVRQAQRAALKQQAELALTLAAGLSLVQEQDVPEAGPLPENA